MAFDEDRIETLWQAMRLATGCEPDDIEGLARFRSEHGAAAALNTRVAEATLQLGCWLLRFAALVALAALIAALSQAPGGDAVRRLIATA
jgi:hypothetical protein